MIKLSNAIQRGTAITEALSAGSKGFFRFHTDSPPQCDTLGAALVGSMFGAELTPFWQSLKAQSLDSQCSYVIRGLNRAFPHLGCSVRTWPKLAAELEETKLIPKCQHYSVEYRQEIHMSLWRAITEMERLGDGEPMQIAQTLQRHGL